MVTWQSLNLTSCGCSKFMKVICAFDELVNVVHVEYHPSSNSYSLVNFKVFLKNVVSWDWLLMYPLSLNFGLRNLQKATWPLFWECVYLTRSGMSLKEDLYNIAHVYQLG